MTNLPARSVLITGANGFVGRALCEALGEAARPTVRSAATGIDQATIVESIDGSSNWRHALEGVEAVVHLAALAHRSTGQVQGDLYSAINTHGAINLARQARESGVRRFVFMSTAKVYGDESDQVYSESDPYLPIGPYAESKAAAEVAILEMSGAMEVVVLQPPLIYGPGVKANFRTLMRLVQLGVPLPFGRVQNARSMVALSNLVSAITVALRSDAVPGGRFIVSDGIDLSTPELIRRLAASFGKKDRLVSVPLPWLRSVARQVGQEAPLSKLIDNFRVDSSLFAAATGWRAPVTIDAAIQETSQWFRIKG